MVKISHKIFFVILAVLFLASCSQSLPSVNETFQKKYGQDIARMNADRISPKNLDNQVTTFSAPSQEEIYNQGNGGDSGYYAYVDVSKFGSRNPQNYMPSREAYEQSKIKNPNQLPDDIFEITYNTGLYPPFQRIGAEFDAIDIPPYDAHGVKTAMSDKTYLLAGGDALQRSVDTVTDDRTRYDVENSQILIAEQKKLKQKQKMEKIFGKNNYVELASLKSTQDDSEEAIKKSEKHHSSQTQSKPAAAASGFVAKTIKN